MLGPVVLDVASTVLTTEEADTLRRPHVGGVILFSRNFSSVEQVTKLVADIRAVRQDLLIAVDQEGGRVQRFKQPFSRLPAMQKIGIVAAESQENAERIACDVGWLMAAELKTVGIDISFAPVLDLDDQHSQVIGDRSFSKDAVRATQLAAAFIQGMHKAGMRATAKHFPGHGSVLEDSHTDTVVDDRPLRAIQAHDMQPFAKLVHDYDAVMPAHVIYPQVDKHPVGFSKHWLQDILRNELGFQGVIFSDDLSMAAAEFAGDIGSRGLAALKAGCDAVLVCNKPDSALNLLTTLEAAAWPINNKLSCMRQPTETSLSLADLQKTELWQQASNSLATLEK